MWGFIIGFASATLIFGKGSVAVAYIKQAITWFIGLFKKKDTNV